MVVGEAPGRQEELAREPFIGPAGELLRSRLLAVGINPSEVYFTNICKYRPPMNELRQWFDKKSGMPNMTVLEGMMELKEEIAAIQPNVIVALGNFPLWALTRKAKWKRTGDDYGYTGISDWRGSIIEGARGIADGCKVVAAYHPAAVLRKYPWLQTLHLDLERVRAQSLFPEIRRPNKTLIIDPQGSDREQWRDWLLSSSSPFITFDIEQIGSDLLCIGFTADKDRAVTIRTRTAADIQWCRDILLSGKPLCGQNVIFDCAMLEYWNRFPKILDYVAHDTMLASHAAYIELPKDLGFLCSIYTEQPCYWTNVDWKAVRADKSKADSVDFLTYNAIDTWVTHDVAEQQLADELQDPKVRHTFEHEMSLVPVLWEMSKRGMKVDAKKMQTIRATCETIITEKSAQLNVLAGRSLNVMSNLQVAKLLFDELGLKPIKRGKPKNGKPGTPSADDKTLAELDLQATTPMQKGVISLIRDIRKNRSLISKFTEIEYDADGRMRCHYKPAGTTTGRLASAKFFPTGTGANLQNIPRDKRVRSVFVPDEGYTFFYNDLERAESLVVAMLTGDPTMLAHHQPGKDAHKLLASLLFDKDPEEVGEDERYMGKQTRHAGNYMEGWRTFMINVNKIANVTGVSITAAEAKFFIQRYRELHPYLAIWWRETEKELRKPAHRLYNLLGRPRTFYDRLDNTLPTAIAYVPQSTIGDVLNVGLVRCARDEELRDYDCQLLVQVHDAIGGQVKTEYAERAMIRMAELMQVDLEVPKTGEHFSVPVELTLGPSWGECKKIATERLAA